MKTFNENGILSTIGNTPLLPLDNLFKGEPFRVFGECEGFNPGGSAKDRAALNMLRQGISSGQVNQDTVVIESSSGNLGIGLSLICCAHRLRFICVVDARTSQQNIDIIQAYGTEVIKITEPDPETGELLQARLKKISRLKEENPNHFWPNQYQNENNPLSHQATAKEICDALGKAPDYLICAVSTCGTVRGFAEYFKKHSHPTKVIAVDLKGSQIFGATSDKRFIPGLGSGLIPVHYKKELLDGYVQVSDEDAVIGCHRLIKEEAMFMGGSSGAVVTALEVIKPIINQGETCVLLLSDRGGAYLNTVYSQTWLTQTFGVSFYQELNCKLGKAHHLPPPKLVMLNQDISYEL